MMEQYLINRNIVQQVGIGYYICNMVVRKLYNIKVLVTNYIKKNFQTPWSRLPLEELNRPSASQEIPRAV